MRACPWCKEIYDITPESELTHLYNCDRFQSLPIAEIKNGKEFIQHPEMPHVFVERYPKRLN
jgi:hypothetical protein